MWEWVFNVSVVIILTIIISILMPEGKLTGIINLVLSISIVFIIIKPLNSLEITNVFDDVSFVQDMNIDYSFAEFSNYLRGENIKNICKKTLNNEGYSVNNIELTYDENEFSHFVIKSVKINLSNEGINSNNTHIDIIEKIKNTLSNLLAVDKEVVKVEFN